jgi:hypothetical protein
MFDRIVSDEPREAAAVLTFSQADQRRGVPA